MRLVALVLAHCALGAATHTFTEHDLPAPFGFVGIRKFYVSDLSSSKGQDIIVQLKDVHLTAKEGHEEDKAVAEATAEISMIPYSHLDKLVNTKHFCDFASWDAPRASLILQKHAAQEKSLVATVTSTGNLNAKKVMKGSGVYLLAVSNCGNATEVELQGTVTVRSPHGFLDGLDYWKTQLYLCVVLSYAVLVVINVVILALKSDFLSMGPSGDLRSGVTLIALFGLGEAGTYYYYLLQFNTKGEGGNMNEISEVFGIMKTFHAILVGLYIANGEHLRVKESEQGTCKTLKALSFVAFVMAMGLPRSCVFAEHHYITVPGHWLSLSALLLLSAMTLLISSLTYLMRTTSARLKEENQTDEARQTYRGYSALIFLAFAIGASSILGQLFLDVPGDLTGTWQTHVFWSDGLVQCGFVVGLAIATLLVKPEEMEGKGYLTVEHNGAPEAAVVGNAEDTIFADDMEAAAEDTAKGKEEASNEETAGIMQSAE